MLAAFRMINTDPTTKSLSYLLPLYWWRFSQWP